MYDNKNNILKFMNWIHLTLCGFNYFVRIRWEPSLFTHWLISEVTIAVND